jgi:hypothetical protein
MTKPKKSTKPPHTFEVVGHEPPKPAPQYFFVTTAPTKKKENGKWWGSRDRDPKAKP